MCGFLSASPLPSWRHAEIARSPRQPPVARGEPRTADQRRREQMLIDPAEPLAHQPMVIDKLQHLRVGHDGGGGKLLEEREHFGPGKLVS